MLGGIGAYIASEVSSAVKRNTTIYGLYALSGLLLVCAAGYGLNALYTMLAFRLGAVAASLWVGGGMLVLAIVAVLVANAIKNRPRPSRPMAQTALLAAPFAAKLVGRRMNWKTGTIAGIAVLGLIIGRQIFKGRDEDFDDEA